jgi:hypothetical protein
VQQRFLLTTSVTTRWFRPEADLEAEAIARRQAADTKQCEIEKRR